MDKTEKLKREQREAYLQGIADERRRIRGLLEIDLLLLSSENPAELVQRALQMIDNPNLQISEPPSGGTEGLS